jgi:PAS domain S-box-containing protein/diguanylate cyclase (GGDEF)-like protein
MNQSPQAAALGEFSSVGSALASARAFAAMAADLCAMPIALISLGDEGRQEPFAAIGLTPEQALDAMALCRHDSASRAPIVVLDVAHDPRFRGSPLAAGEPGIAFCAAVPLAAADGKVLGTLAVMDHKSRRLSARQRELLLTLARQLLAQCEPGLWIRAAADPIAENGQAEFAAMRLAAIVESSRDAIIGMDLHGAVTSWNRGAEEMFGYRSDEMIGTSIREILPADRQHEEDGILQTIARGDRVDQFETVRCAKDGHLIEVSISVSPIKDATGAIVGVSKSSRDISELRRRERDAQQLSRLYYALSQINQTIVCKRTREELVQNTCRILVENAGFALAWIGWYTPETHLLAPIAVSGDDHGYVRGIRVYADDRAEGRGPAGIAFRSGHRHICNDALHDPAMQPWRESMERASLRAAAAFPIREDGRVVGTLAVYAKAADFFQEREIALLEEAAMDIGFGLGNLAREQAAHEAQIAVQRERQFTDAMIQSVPGILYLYDKDGRFLLWNRQFELVSGYVPEEIARMHPLDFFSVADQALVESRITEVFASGEATVEARFVTKDGRSLPYFFTGRRVQLNGAPCLVGIGIDISTRLEAENARKLSEERYRQLFEYAPDGILIADHDSVYLDANPSICEMLGYARDELVGKSAADIVEPAALPQVAPALEIIGSGANYHAEWLFVRKDGSRVDVEASATLMPEGNILAVIRDISDRKRAQEQLRQSEDRFRAVFEQAGLGIAILDAVSRRFIQVNPMLAQMLGYEPEELQSMTAAQVGAPESAAASNMREQLFRGEIDHYQVERAYCRKDGGELWGVLTATLVRDADGSPAFSICLLENRTAQKQQERRIARMNRVHAVIGGIHSAILRRQDRDGLLRDACRVAISEGVFALAWAAEIDPVQDRLRTIAIDGVATDAANFIEFARHTIPDENQLIWRALRAAKPVVVNDLHSDDSFLPTREQLVKRGIRSGAAFPLFVSGKAVAALVFLAAESDFFDADEIVLLEWLTRDLSYALEHANTARRLEQLTYYDPLTGLKNTQAFHERLLQFEENVRLDKMCLCICAIDLENFTGINERYGRALGDELLRKTAERLRKVVGEAGAVGRVGGDNFALAELSPDSTHAQNLLERVFAAFDAPFQIGGQALSVLVRVGIAQYPDDADPSDGHFDFDHANSALKHAKASNERFAYFSAELSARAKQTLTLEAQLREALKLEQFVLAYQPRVDMRSGEIVGAEALIRWQHPERGLIGPTEFIGAAEHAGLIVPIGGWVIERVCAQQAAWRAAGIPIVPVGANVSSAQIERGDLLQVVQDALARHSLEPSRLELELTESVVMQDMVRSGKMLARLREFGVGLALDDFGTGYSSLSYLKRLPFHRVKIDRSFIHDITSSVEDAAIAAAIIDIARRIRLKVVAEGVETQGQFNYLLRHDCDEMQGNYFSPAVDAGLFASYLLGGRSITIAHTTQDVQRTVLVVDDEPGIRSALARVLRRDGYRILTASDGNEALALLALHPVQVIVSDQRMPGMSGTELFGVVKELYPDTMRIILSGYTDLKVVTDSVNRGAVFRFLTKPWDDDLLREQVRDAFSRHQPSRNS